ncbi:CPA1 family monovalent cation:H+ antiporter [Arcanobacterium wilhelmae]|uniref:CPA1 family monovalent cation:H+ antiporter n=1 Tax=Arcanobacterium wilhelmae TaxID=1803177 RepID=A0ABT9NC62_9ACTO|nr:sodium:proton antiporter [Arcanobacterium wilhelmae]MDP9801272.1 CPA1 family monovalent cation:H+ antiporter [Arcanobacterium wilhelmae]WFN90618.1 sodium:proton antiporter [Arcanobacterium wilhelmae]
MLVLIVVFLAVTVASVTLGDRLRLPYPILMLFSAMGLTFVAGIEAPAIDPEIILPLFLPPLLFATAQRTSWAIFRQRWKVLLTLAFILTALTALAVAGVVWWLIPGISFPFALLIGAIVAPPDPVAVDAVAGPAGMPRRLMTVLQTEGLFNDAVAIVLFQYALAATVAKQDSVSATVVLSFFYGVAIATLIGFILGYLYRTVGRITPNLEAQVAASVVVPFAAYLSAEHLGASGVIAVVVTALETNRRGRPQDGAARLARTAFWDIANMLVTGAAFGLIGLEMRTIVATEDTRWVTFILPAAAVCMAVFALRFVVVMLLGRVETRENWGTLARHSILLVWSGMRGLATLALALAIPTTAGGAPLPHRDAAIVIAVTVLLVTLVPTGLSLPFFARHILPESPSTFHHELTTIIRRAQHASLKAVREEFGRDGFDHGMAKVLQTRFTTLREELEVELPQETGDQPDALGDSRLSTSESRARRAQVNQMIRIATDAARQEVLCARDELNVDPAVADLVLRKLDVRMMAVAPLPWPRSEN